MLLLYTKLPLFRTFSTIQQTMGTYLSTPVTEKNTEHGTSSRVSWGVVDMQGWRKSMEDAHIADTDAGVFAIFDGHGGPEVARFCQLYLVNTLRQQVEWNERPGDAMIQTFHAIDRMIDDPQRRYVTLGKEIDGR